MTARRPIQPPTLAQIRARAAEAEREEIRAALERNSWRVKATARELDTHETTLRRLLDSLGLAQEYQERNPGRGRPRRDPQP